VSTAPTQLQLVRTQAGTAFRQLQRDQLDLDVHGKLIIAILIILVIVLLIHMIFNFLVFLTKVSGDTWNIGHICRRCPRQWRVSHVDQKRSLVHNLGASRRGTENSTARGGGVI